MIASFVHGKLYHKKILPQLTRQEKIAASTAWPGRSRW
jgi:hypothetical protein